MKIAAMNPLFVVESSPAAEGSEAKRVSHKLGVLRLVESSGAASTSTDGEGSSGPGPESQGDSEDEIENEPRERLKRLSRLIHRYARYQDQNETMSSEPPKGRTWFDADFKKRKALNAYQDVASSNDPLNSRGLQLDIIY